VRIIVSIEQFKLRKLFGTSYRNTLLSEFNLSSLSYRYQRTKAHPRTPDIRQVCSKRSWDGQIRKWRRLLHEFDPPKDEDEEDPEQMFAPGREQDRSAEYVEDTLMDMQSEYVEDQDLKIYEGWSDDEC
jgi:histone RNA hairpin-binding protein